MTEPNTDLPRLAPGTYLLAKRVVVKEDGLSEFVDEPEGEYIKGFWPRTRTRVTPVVDEETNLKPDTPRVSMAELREKIGAVVDDYTAGEDYGSGPTRYYLTVNTPNDLTAHLAAVLFPGLDWLFRAVADWQSLWDEKEEWEKAAKEAWQRENVLSWLHAEAIWHAERHRADVDTRDLSLALQRAGFRSMKDQVDAMGRRIRELDAEVERLQASRFAWAREADRQEQRADVVDFMMTGTIKVMDREQAEANLATETLGAIWLYVDWRYVTRQLTTEQKELWADAVDAFGDPEHVEPKAERWWRDDFVERRRG